jgi:hypothetical protein
VSAAGALLTALLGASGGKLVAGPWLNAHPEDRDRIVAALVEARLLANRE